MDTTVKKVILLFKTHLDVGYTDFAKNVIDNYINNYIPTAIRLARTLKESGRSERFVWTVGSWLIERYFAVSDENACMEMERAIREGDISYHALPFTTHTEAMDEGLFRYGLSIAKKLDAQFGKTTIAGKFTDVPGHTKAMIPYLKESGVSLLHIGVNPASMPPDVPDFFVWNYDEQHEILVVYNKGYYGEAARIPGTDTIIHFAHTNDNCGPQTVEDILSIYAEIWEEYPNAEIIASDLNEVAREVMQVKDCLPVVTEEMGDTWIHGQGTDPRKVSGYRSLLRLCKQFEKQERNAMYAHLLMVPEHTWGMCEMKHLGDYETFTKDALQAAIKTEKYQHFMASWTEQRQYVLDAVDALTAEVKRMASDRLAEAQKDIPDVSSYTSLTDRTDLSIAGYIVSFDETGAICDLRRDGAEVLPGGSKVGTFSYEVFGAEDFARFQDQYLTNKFDWALEDFGKIGCEKVLQKGKQYVASLIGLYKKENELLAELALPEEAAAQYGGPRKAYLSYQFYKDRILLDFSWHDKDANRLGEALWLECDIPHSVCEVRKLGKWIDTADVVSKGGRSLHASDFGIRLDGTLTIESLDTALIAPFGPSLLNFTDQLPATQHKIAFNLYNNIWGTNFPMWYSEDARFRFAITF